ncbi:hypothetical protein [Rhodoblastus sp.]|uniref:hypothetical protein n=1 Tax=Rhodoblastus sp. TaxID=1962975 RepID=UPI002634A844|nr:hypothetical protein [Rhodoblastus sp.]
MKISFIYRLRDSSADETGGPAPRMSYAEQLRRAAQQPPPPDPPDPLKPWRDKIRDLRGVTGPDGVERITTRSILDILEVPKLERHTFTRQIAPVLLSLGWKRSKVWRERKGPGGRVRRVRVRGYARAHADVLEGAGA